MMERSLNFQLIDITILRRGWTKERAALECGITCYTLNRIYASENVRNDVILRISNGLDIPLDQLVVWRSVETPPIRTSAQNRKRKSEEQQAGVNTSADPGLKNKVGRMKNYEAGAGALAATYRDASGYA